MHAPRGNQLRLTRSACLNKVIYLSIYLAQNMSDGYISRQRIDTSLLKNEKTAFKVVV